MTGSVQGYMYSGLKDYNGLYTKILKLSGRFGTSRKKRSIAMLIIASLGWNFEGSFLVEKVPFCGTTCLEAISSHFEVKYTIYLEPNVGNLSFLGSGLTCQIQKL